MGKDTAFKRFFADDRRFADVINAFGCHGEQYVKPEDLTEVDSREGIWSQKSVEQILKKEKSSAQKDRDVVRKVAFGTNFAIMGVENQELEDYGIAYRVMSYDVSRYAKQVEEIKKQVRDKVIGEGTLSEGEYLYRFPKDSRLHPVVTFVLYYGEEAFEGATDLHGLLDFSDIPEEIQHLVQNYKINFIDIREPGALELLHTDVKQVFEFIRDAKDEEKWQEHMRENPILDITALEVVAEFTNTKQLKDLNEKYGQGGVIHMCKAWDDHFESGMRKGKVEGKAEGKAEGEQRMADLISRLYTEGKMEIVPEIVTNVELRNQYYAQYSL